MPRIDVKGVFACERNRHRVLVVRIGVWLPKGWAHLPSSISYSSLMTCIRAVTGLRHPRAGRSCSCESGDMMFACCLPLRVMVMIVALACLIIRFRTFVFPSLRRSLPLRAMPLPVRIAARSTGRSPGRTWCIWKSLLCCRLSLLGVRALVVCQLWRPITFIRKT